MSSDFGIYQRQVLLSRPGMYLATYDQKLNAGSLLLNFLIGANSLIDADVDDVVDILVANHTFTVSFISKHFTLAQLGVSDISSDFDITQDENPLPLSSNLSLFFWKPIVWFSEFCSINIEDHKAHYRQYFFHGEAIGETTQLIAKPASPYGISFAFSVSSDLFNDTHLRIDDLKRVIEVWQDREIPKSDLSSVQVNSDWYQHSDLFYSC